MSHKKTSALLAIILAFAAYKATANFRNDPDTVQYVTAQAERGTIISSVTGMGQVSASNQVEVTSEVSGKIISVSVKLGDRVEEGQTLATLDSSDAARAVRNAELSLENAEISYQKAQKQASDQTGTSTASDINKAYDGSYNALSSALIDAPDIIAGARSIFYDPGHSPYFNDQNIKSYAGQTAIDYKYEAGRNLDQAKKDYDAAFRAYKSLTPSNRQASKALTQDTYDMVKKLHTALTGAYNTIDYVKQNIPDEYVPDQIATDKNALSSSIGKLSNHIDALSKALSGIEDAKDSATTASLDLKSAELKVSEALDSLQKAREEAGDHTIEAPFAGLVGKIDVKAGDRLSQNGQVATIIADDKIAEVSLNEVDIPKVQNGQKATLTFDAIEDLTITGQVTEVELLGTVSQGVVSYDVKISFDVDDERVKPGMSLSAAIINETRENVVVVPNSAIKSQSGTNYVETLKEDGSVARVPVRIGLSNDESTEIISGLNEGDSYIVRSVSSSAAASRQSAPGLFGSGRARSNENVRFQR